MSLIFELGTVFILTVKKIYLELETSVTSRMVLSFKFEAEIDHIF